ncbi:MAG: RdgB/HAM1 family non-canonical purine NTP pyrophosphatase [Acidobacteriota bacterium]|nr:RdgB/HAM1 family non-canonical purine NTP pyrophosphatase [Acidobacteriota bacterium]
MKPAVAPRANPALWRGKLLVATTNPNKLKEIRPLMDDGSVELVTLADLASVPEPEETGTTFWENARIKALAYAAATNLVTVAEDSGFEVDALGGEPGVQSARFLGPAATYDARFAEIFRRLAGRSSPARFVTALAVARGQEILFETETVIEGTVAEAPRGEHGFGYDPIFLYLPLGRTTAEMTISEKAAVSHRARAFRDLRRWLTPAR